MRAAALVLTGAIVLAAGARAEDLADAVPGHPGLRWFDLMKLVVTDLAPDGKNGGTGHHVVAFTHFPDKKVTVVPTDPIRLDYVDVMPIPDDASRILVLADLGPPKSGGAHADMLALFALAPTPRLLDLVEVGGGQETGFHEGLPQTLAAGSPLIIVTSSDGGSSRSSDESDLLFLRDDRLAFIDSVFTVGDEGCAYSRTEEPTYATLPDAGPYRALEVVVTETVKLTGDPCGEEMANWTPKLGVRTYQTTWRWDPRAGRFASNSAEWRRFEGAMRNRASGGGAAP